MWINVRTASVACLLAIGPGLLLTAPVAAAECNDSSGTTVCAQGDIRGTHGPPPAMPSLGSYGSWCNGAVCFGGNLGFGIFISP